VLRSRDIQPLETTNGFTPSYTLRFNHQGGFGNLMPRGSEADTPHVHGALLRLRQEQMRRLSGFEGGYCTEEVEVVTYKGDRVRAVTFITKPAFLIQEGLPTTDVYKAKLCAGARHLSLEPEYVVRGLASPGRALSVTQRALSVTQRAPSQG
jgi:gamma-glutamylcyclotransferase (GGCT)/AIG2-like uncharacterized protein YtfP